MLADFTETAALRLIHVKERYGCQAVLYTPTGMMTTGIMAD